MKLVGATRRFIRRPFIIRAVFQGLLAALIAIALLAGLLLILRRSFASLFEVFSAQTQLIVMGIIVASGVLICVLSTFFVVNRLVSLSKDELYY
jgi:cell division transport system permease protein